MEDVERSAPVPPETRRLMGTALRATAAFSLAAHGFLFANEFFSHDAVSYYAYADWGMPLYAGLGRFLLPLYQYWKGGAAAPWLIGGLFILWTALAACLVIRLLGIRSRTGEILVCGLLSTNLSLTLTGAAYVYCMDEYALALLGAAGAAYGFRRGGRYAAAGLAALTASLALYQPYFTVAAALCFLSVLRETAAGERVGVLIRRGVRYLALLAAGFGLYALLWAAVRRALGIASRRTAALPAPNEIPGLLLTAYRRYFAFLFGGAGTLGALLPVVHGALALLLAWRLVRCLRTLPAANRALLLLCVCLIPAAAHSVFLLIPGEAHALTAYARELPYLLAALAMEPAERDGPVPPDVWRRAVLIALCLVLWSHVVFANQAYLKKDLEKNATLLLAARVVDRIESVADYRPGETPVAFAGRLDHNEALQVPRTAFRDLSGQVGLVWNYAATYNLGRYLTDYLGYPLHWDQAADPSQWAEVQRMPVFPAAGSVAMVRGTVVVKLSG